jgi:dipeptidyl aminopeptidase/acylaminoacyl peptidase
MDGIAELKNSLIKERREELLPWNWRLQRVLQDGSDDVIIEQYQHDGLGEYRTSTLARLDTRSGRKRTVLAQAPDDVYDWLVDGQGRPAAATSIAKDEYTMHLPSADGKAWTRWRSGKRLAAEGMPWWFDVGPKGDLFLVGPGDTGDNNALLRFDPKQPDKAPQVLMSVKGYDFDGELVFDQPTGALLGAHYEGESQDSVWFDPGMKALQAELDKALPATVNRIICSDCLGGKAVVVQSMSDRQPSIYSLYQRDSKTLKPLLLARPWIKAETMAARQPQRIQARDGLSLPLMLTRPKSKQALPTVVLVHGGPFVRGNHWEWSDTAQFLASRGYLVIEPDFRGSAGYGGRHQRAGWKQWGLAMQDDVADAAQWAIAKGLADPKRICIAGASYGGYAAMMGLIKNPELFRCGINWVGVSDLKLMFSSLDSDQGALGRSYDMPLTIGDPAKDGERLDATSPLKQAARLKQPLLMAYGAADRRVHMEHGVKMRDALATAGNQQVEWVLYPQEGHGWRAIETQKDFWGRVERFLQRHIGAALP